MSVLVQRVNGFTDWRDLARCQLLLKTPPSSLIWQPADDERQFLFDVEQPQSAASASASVSLPKAFIELAAIVARHRNPNRWGLLYKVAWRIQNEHKHLLRIETDDDIIALNLLRKAVELDIYKMRAFVRFRRVDHDGAEQYVAWYRPDHHTLDANERFFTDRFAGMNWAILTPDRSVFWDGRTLHQGPGVPRSEAPPEDAVEDLWRAYYSSIYNPARLNLDAMRAQLPVRRWADLPESRTIPELVRTSPGRVASMVRNQPPSASAFIPHDAALPDLRESVHQCTACELCRHATQPVFGEGAEAARLLLVGEQPGDEEDRQGRPFIGPAGNVLTAAMTDAGVDRSSVYLTNAVKAFRFEERGKRRIHRSPSSVHIATCRPWLDAEIEVVRPRVILCLGATAAQSVLGRSTSIQQARGTVHRHASGAHVIVTYHPSAVLRAPNDELKLSIEQSLRHDLAAAVSLSTQP